MAHTPDQIFGCTPTTSFVWVTSLFEHRTRFLFLLTKFYTMLKIKLTKRIKMPAGCSLPPAETDATSPIKTHSFRFPLSFPLTRMPARVALGFGLGGVFGSIFWKLGLQESSIQNRISLFVNVAMNSAMFGCIRALQTLAIEKKVVALERMDEVST